jgi:hypothetical protein
MKNLNFKKIGFLSLGLLLVVVFSAFLINKNLKDPKFSGPRIEFTMDRVNLGDVKAGPQVQGEYEFKNSGKDKLIISNIQPSCGCTGVVSDEKKEYMPGESGKIKFTFNTEGRMGVNEKTITVTTNDIKNTTKVLSFTCNIVQ